MPPKKADAASEDVGAARFGRVRNNLRMGIVGLPNVGKSSLFNLLTRQSIPVRPSGSGVEDASSTKTRRARVRATTRAEGGGVLCVLYHPTRRTDDARAA